MKRPLKTLPDWTSGNFEHAEHRIMAEFYKHSGTVPVPGAIQTAFAGLGSAITLAWAYSYAIVWIPIVYVNFLLTLGFGAVTGFLIVRAAKAGRIRSSSVAALIGLFSGLAGLYFAWGVDLLARHGWPENGSVFTAFNPAVLKEYIAWYYENGGWGIGRHGGNVTGIPLAIVWLVEAGVILGMATGLPWMQMDELSYCEPCGWWTKKEDAVQQLSTEGAETLVAQISQGNLAPLRDAPRAKPEDLEFLKLNLACCESCGETNYLSIEQIRITIDKKDNRSEKSTTVVDKLAITPADVALVRNAGRVVEPISATPETPDENASV